MPEQDTYTRLYLKSEAVDMGNEEFLSQHLDRLLEHYSYDRLSGLSPHRLRKETAHAEIDFMILERHFPNSSTKRDKDEALRRVALNDSYRDLSKLTKEQQKEIDWTKRMIERNIDRAYQDAKQRQRDRYGRIGYGIANILNVLTNPFSHSFSAEINLDITNDNEKN